jgi:uncharacterized membrane protein
VFAISATLLVLDIRVAPGLGSAQLSQALRDQLPAIAAYAFSFGVIGQLWLFHHRTFGFIARVDTALLVRSLVLLALIAFIPFPVRLLSDYHDQPAAVAIYMATFTAATTVQRLVWVYATGHPHLLSRPVPSGLRVVLAVGAVLAVLVAIAGAVQAFRSPPSDSTLRDRRAWRRYGLIVGLELAVAGAGAAALAAAGQSDFVPVWVCAVVGVHMCPLASLLGDRLLVPLEVLLAAVALVALAAGLAGWVPPSTVTGLGAGVLLTLFAAIALAGVELGTATARAGRR